MVLSHIGQDAARVGVARRGSCGRLLRCRTGAQIAYLWDQRWRRREADTAPRPRSTRDHGPITRVLQLVRFPTCAGTSTDLLCMERSSQLWDATTPNASSRAPPCRPRHRRSDAAAGLEGRAARPHPHSALIALCLHDDDRAFVEGWCIRLGRAAPDPGMRMVAAIGISHLACRFRTVGPEAAEVVRTLATDQVLGENRLRLVEDALRRLERCIQ
jgi:hypothetical protein